MDKLNFKDLKTKRFHFIGIGGISMSGLAFMLVQNKIYVQGSDISQNAETKKLQQKGVKVFCGHNKENLNDADVVVYSSAIKDDNEELRQAKKDNLIILKRAELLGMIAKLYDVVIAVSGSHGKTTTTAMLAEIFMQAGKNPTFHIGGNLNSINASYKIQGKKFFIVEACEYKDNFLYIKPDIAVVLNIDADHLDYFHDLNGVKTSFEKFALGVKSNGIVIASNDDENSAEIIKTHKNVARFGLTNGADVYATFVKEYKPCYYSFDVKFSRFKLGNIKLNILGKHNVYNALASILVAICCGIDFCDIKTAMENFSGVERRCQKIAEINKVQIYHDYAHHPKQIEKMVQVGRELTKENAGRVIVVFEPHTFSRTKFLIDDFAKCFCGADLVIFSPVYSARENAEDGFDSLTLSKAVKRAGTPTLYLKTFEAIKTKILKYTKANDVVLILGAGTIEKLADMFKINSDKQK